jgi:replication factor C subunit 2/4
LGGNYKDAVLELNASDERGIEVVRNKIKMFAQKKVTLPPGRHKVIILDEADNMTPGAQQALRRTMEIYSSTTRFALACNQSIKIIEPIQSRCAIIRFTRLTDSQVLSRILEVTKQEKVSYTEEGLEAIIFTAEGDMRQALNNLQATHAGFGEVTAENVFKVCDQPHPLVIREVIDLCQQAQFLEAHISILGLHNDGYAPQDILQTLFRVVKGHDSLQEWLKLEYEKEIGFAHMRAIAGMATFLQLGGLIARLCELSLKHQQQAT